MSFDINAIRAQFPILQRQVHGKRLVYLDNAASAQKPQRVIDSITGLVSDHYANVHRGLHSLSNEATAAFEEARHRVATFINAPSVDDIIFTSGGTDGFNLVSYALSHHIKPGDEIVLSVMEHHSNIVPWHFLRERFGAVLKWVDIDDDGQIDLDQFRAQLSDRTKLVAITHMSNVLGAPVPVKEMASIVKEYGAYILVDGCQASVHGPVDVQELGVDFYIMTGHKLYGPTGVGVLYGRAALLREFPPFRGGGEMIDKVTQDYVTYNAPPHRFEAGTPPIIEAIALGEALSWIGNVGLDEIARHEASLRAHAMEELAQLDYVHLQGQHPNKAAIISFTVDGAHPHDISTILDRSGVAVRAGHHCAQPLMERLGVSATARASFAAYNDHDDVEALLQAIIKTHKMLS